MAGRVGRGWGWLRVRLVAGVGVIGLSCFGFLVTGHFLLLLQLGLRRRQTSGRRGLSKTLTRWSGLMQLRMQRILGTYTHGFLFLRVFRHLYVE